MCSFCGAAVPLFLMKEGLPGSAVADVKKIAGETPAPRNPANPARALPVRR